VHREIAPWSASNSHQVSQVRRGPTLLSARTYINQSKNSIGPWANRPSAGDEVGARDKHGARLAMLAALALTIS
jgi:hypothetical protein